MEHTNICVVESRWWEAQHTSVRAVFELLSDLHTGNPNCFEYELTNSRDGFRESVERQLRNPNSGYLSIATHGTNQGLSLFNEDGVSRAVIRNLLKKTADERHLAGFHLGCCSFLDLKLVRFFYEYDISPWWIAGYGARVSWVDSTSLDFMFFNRLLEVKKPFDDPLKTIRKVTRSLAKDCPGLIEKLAFQVFVCPQDQDVEQLL